MSGLASKAVAAKMPGYNWRHMPLASAVTYSVISIVITLCNKAVLTSYGYDCAMTLTVLQGIVTVICLEIMKARGYIDFPSFNWETALKVAPLSFTFISYVVVSLVSLGRVNVPMFTALRRLTIVFVMVEEYVLLGVWPSRMINYTVVVMFIGAALAAWKDLTFDPVSYFYLFLTNLFTSLYTVLPNKVLKDHAGLNLFAMQYYNTVTTMPALLLMAWWTGDLGRAIEFKSYGAWFFQFNFMASIFLAFILNMSTFYCTSLNSARTQTVVGQIKNFFAFLAGLVLFDDYIYEPLNFLGLWIGFGGSVWNVWVAYQEKQAKAAAAAAALTAGAAAPAAIADADAATTPSKPSSGEPAAEGTDPEAGVAASGTAAPGDAGAEATAVAGPAGELRGRK